MKHHIPASLVLGLTALAAVPDLRLPTPQPGHAWNQFVVRTTRRDALKGALEAVFGIKAIETGWIPPTINYETPDPLCDLDYVPNQPRKTEPNHVMSNSFGFGGHNATLVVSKLRL